MNKILYISFDGMTDPLGQSQVINYLIGLRAYGYQFDILSLEKPDKLKSQGNYIQNLLDENNIRWFPQNFHHYPPLVSKIYDKMKLMRVAKMLHNKSKYTLIHCRSYPAAEIGLTLKRKTGTKFLFDMRGFWPDEKADGGHWDQKNRFWRMVYNFYKKKEKEFIAEADHIISLTRAGKKEIESWEFYTDVAVTVIPCCANTDYFLPTTPNKKILARKKLFISTNCFVLSYLGSLGTWYMIDEMLLFFFELKKVKPDAVFLIITNSEFKIILEKLPLYSFQKDDVRIINVSFKHVPENMYASDVSISFIKPVYSKMSSSPVKIGETLSMGIPMIANNIGDSGLFIQENKLGETLNNFNKPEMKKVIGNIDQIALIDSDYIRKIALKEYSLLKGIKLYADVYADILS